MSFFATSCKSAGNLRISYFREQVSPQLYTDKKEKKIFLIYKEIQKGAVAKSYMRKSFLI
jgi:hypothetical protein